MRTVCFAALASFSGCCLSVVSGDAGSQPNAIDSGARDAGIGLGDSGVGLDAGVADDGGTPVQDAGSIAMLCADGGPIVLVPVWSTVFPPNLDVFSLPGVADFDGDGRPELSLSFLGTINLASSDGQGGFSLGPPVIAFSPSAELEQMVVGDFDGDGHPDIGTCWEATGPMTSVYAQVFLGDGHGAFDAGVAVLLGTGYGFDGALCDALVGRDLDGDGRLDLAAVRIYPAATSSLLYDGGCVVDLITGDGRGNLAEPTELTFSSTDAPSGLAIEDFDGDGHLDVVVLGANSILGPGDDAVMGERRGLADGGFGEEGFVRPPTAGWGWGVGDLNGDGLPDLVMSDGPEFAVALAQPDGGFLVGTVPMLAGWYANELMLHDVDGDGKLDLITRAWDPSRAFLATVVALGEGDGGFVSPITLAGGNYSFNGQAPVVGSFDDGGLLIVFADGHTDDFILTTTFNSQRVERCP